MRLPQAEQQPHDKHDGHRLSPSPDSSICALWATPSRGGVHPTAANSLNYYYSTISTSPFHAFDAARWRFDTLSSEFKT